MCIAAHDKKKKGTHRRHQLDCRQNWYVPQISNLDLKIAAVDVRSTFLSPLYFMSMLKNNGVNNGHGLKNVTCKQGSSHYQRLLFIVTGAPFSATYSATKCAIQVKKHFSSHSRQVHFYLRKNECVQRFYFVGMV